MADLKEVLKGYGIDDSTLEAISSKLPADKKLHVLEDGQFVPKTRFDEVNEQKNTFKKQAEELNAQVSELGKFKGSVEELQKKLGDVESGYKTQLQEVEQRFVTQRLNLELDTAITLNKGKNPKAIKALLDMNSIKIDGDKVVGINEQLEAIKQSDSYLFDVEQPTPPPSRAGKETNPPNALPDEVKKWTKL